MTLRPRYSLLTLLLLTALVAGGVKLWYGPHHVVERIENFKEVEYTFARDLYGNKTIQGVLVERPVTSNGTPGDIRLECYRQGVRLEFRMFILVYEEGKTYGRVYTAYSQPSITTTSLENAELQRAAEKEYQRLEALGYVLDKHRPKY